MHILQTLADTGYEWLDFLLDGRIGLAPYLVFVLALVTFAQALGTCALGFGTRWQVVYAFEIVLLSALFFLRSETPGIQFGIPLALVIGTVVGWRCEPASLQLSTTRPGA